MTWDETLDERVIPVIIAQEAQGLLPPWPDEAGQGALVAPTAIIEAIAAGLPTECISIEALGADWRSDPPEYTLKDGRLRVVRPIRR